MECINISPAGRNDNSVCNSTFNSDIAYLINKYGVLMTGSKALASPYSCEAEASLPELYLIKNQDK